jgi:hypothetical protein
MEKQNLSLTPVQSSLIQAIGWDESTNELIIQFPRGATYAYSGEQARQHYDQLMNPETESIGKYFLANIKNKPEVPYRRIDAQSTNQSAAGTLNQLPGTPAKPKRRAAALNDPTPLKQLF